MSSDHPFAPLACIRYLLFGLAAGMLAVAAACGGAATPVNTFAPVATPATAPTPTQSPIRAATEVPVSGPVVRVDRTDIPVELAVKPEERIKGLSARASLGAGTGMLFIFEVESRLRFWMREMEFPLDMVWIGANCKVVDISVDVPPPEPGTPLNDLPRYSPEAPAMYVLEINGGEAEILGLGPGDPVEFLDELADRYGC